VSGISYPVVFTGTEWVVGGYSSPGAPGSSLPGFNETGIVNCFLIGTLIETERGSIPIEELTVGDSVTTLTGGFVPIKWIGKQKRFGYFVPKRKSPVLIRAAALGEGLPKRDLWVSPGHSMKIGEYFVDARLLVNGVTIIQEQWSKEIEYYHIDLGEHHCILAEGAWSESYAECGNRGSFYNVDDFISIYPEQKAVDWTDKCLPHISTRQDFRLQAIFSSLLSNIPTDCVVTEPDLHLLADGLRIDPYEFIPQSYMFRVPAGTRVLRLKSRSSSPCQLGLSSDERQLGFCVTGLTAHSVDASFKITIGSNNPKLVEGFHQVEVNARRWTQGDALLPSVLLCDGTDELILTIKGNPLPRYHLREADFCEAKTITNIQTA